MAFYIAHSPYALMRFTTLCGDFDQTALSCLQFFEWKFLQMPPISETRPDHNTRNFVPYSLRELCVGSLTSPANQYREDTGDGTYGLLSLSEKTKTSNHLRMSLQRQHILLSSFKTLSVGPVWGLNSRPPAWQSGALPIQLSRRWLYRRYSNPNAESGGE